MEQASGCGTSSLWRTRFLVHFVFDFHFHLADWFEQSQRYRLFLEGTVDDTVELTVE